jgi:hypothetical protein
MWSFFVPLTIRDQRMGPSDHKSGFLNSVLAQVGKKKVTQKCGLLNLVLLDRDDLNTATSI